jgi:hypothetical protein
MAADTFLNTSCSSSPSVCASAVSTACPMNCTGTCSTSTSKCELALNVSTYKSIDLVSEQPELSTLNDEPVIKVTIDSVKYAVTANTLSVPTPEMGVYVAPINVMDPLNPMAKKIGTIQAVPPGATVASRDMDYTTDGKAALIEAMSTYKNPFNVIVGTGENPIMVTTASMVPTGKLDAVIQIKAHAGI